MRISMQFENRLCPLLRQRLSVRKEATSVAFPWTEALYPHGGPTYVALPQTEALCLHGGPPYVALSDRGSLSLRQRLSVPQTEALCPYEGPPFVALPQIEALYPYGGPPFVALPQTEPPSVALSVIATLVSPDRAVQQITARLPCTPDI